MKEASDRKRLQKGKSLNWKRLQTKASYNKSKAYDWRSAMTTRGVYLAATLDPIDIFSVMLTGLFIDESPVTSGISWALPSSLPHLFHTHSTRRPTGGTDKQDKTSDRLAWKFQSSDRTLGRNGYTRKCSRCSTRSYQSRHPAESHLHGTPQTVVIPLFTRLPPSSESPSRPPSLSVSLPSLPHYPTRRI